MSTISQSERVYCSPTIQNKVIVFSRITVVPRVIASLELTQIPLQLDREGIKEREDGERGEGGGGDYSRETIMLNISIKGRRLIEGWLLFEEIYQIPFFILLDEG